MRREVFSVMQVIELGLQSVEPLLDRLPLE
jgi:hypothetical protein